jgi:hypothetical protein
MIKGWIALGSQRAWELSLVAGFCKVEFVSVAPETAPRSGAAMQKYSFSVREFD